METRTALCGLVIALAAGCATTSSGGADAQVRPGNDKVQGALDHATFFHPECPPSRIAVKRLSQNGRDLELDVCGSVRRYQDVSPKIFGEVVEPTWVDVTTDTAR